MDPRTSFDAIKERLYRVLLSCRTMVAMLTGITPISVSTTIMPFTIP